MWKTQEEMMNFLKDSATINNGKLEITNEAGFRESAEELTRNAVFNSNEELKNKARWIIWEASILLGCPSTSIQNLYMARGENAYKDFTVPAINIRTMTFDVSRTIFKTLKKLNSKTCLFEIARSEISYTFQRPAEYTAAVLGAAIAEGYKGPVCLQGDHFQVKASNWKTDPSREVGAVKDLITEAVNAGFYNIDIDTSTLVDLDQTSVEEEQRNNFEVTAELTKHVRNVEPKDVTVSVGGEIGEVGGKNSNKEELIAYLDGTQKLLEGIKGPSKISIQTGTSHGGVPLPDGSVAEVKLDFNCLEELGKVARDTFHIGGVVQHGASTLPLEAFDNFTRTQTLEVHLATGFQNIIYDSKHLPKEIKDEIYTWLKDNCASDRKDSWTDEQFYYKTRKKGFGPVKEKMWDMPVENKNAIMAELETEFTTMFKKLGIENNAEIVDKYI